MKLDIDKLEPVPVDLSKLSHVVKNDVVKKTMYDNLVEKIDKIGTSGFVWKTKYQTSISELEKKIHEKLKNWKNKISNVYNFVTKADSNSKETEFNTKFQILTIWQQKVK